MKSGLITPPKPLFTFRARSTHVLKKEKQSGVIYSIPCGECNIEYIGQTSRALETMKKEHQAAVRLAKTKNSALDMPSSGKT